MPDSILKDIRRFLGQRPWTSLIIPSGEDWDLDRKLCSEDFLRYLVHIRPEDPGLILQIEEPPGDTIALLDVFPAFRTALTESTNWPGILVWTAGGDSIFLPFGTRNPAKIEDQSRWIFSHLATSIGVDLGLLKVQYYREFSDLKRSHRSTIHFLHMSDLHIGSTEASRRLPRIQQIIRNVFDEIGGRSRIVPVISGDLMDSPNERYLDGVRSFIDFISSMTTDEPVLVLGNHDMRKDGYLFEKLGMAIRMPVSHVVWYESEQIGLVCFNSAVEGKLARGFIGESQLIDVGNQIDRHRGWEHNMILATLHHHPIPVEIPKWYSRPFYERILGNAFEKTEELEDAASFLSFTHTRKIAAILHGHKHIPRADRTDGGVPVFGCGSSVGKVSTSDGGVYISLNVITVDGMSKKISGRLLAERVPGGGLIEEKRHEIVMRTKSFRPPLE